MLSPLFLLLLSQLSAAPNARPAPEARPATAATTSCSSCERWNRPHPPVHVFGNTWWVGVAGLSVVAIDTGEGLILLDGALPQSVPHVEANLAAAKLRLGEVKLIGNSHAHFDHAGGIAALQKRTGATVLASARSAEALRTGCPTADDPQAGFGCAVNGFPPVTGPMRVIQDGEVVRLGKVALTAHLTPGHTPGSTTWTWRACEGKRCLDLVYADSLTAVSAGDFRFTPMKSDLEATFDKVAKLPCDVLLTTHPDASDTLEQLSSGKAKAGDPALRNQCAPYAQRARRNLAKRIAEEAAASAATSP